MERERETEEREGGVRERLARLRGEVEALAARLAEKGRRSAFDAGRQVLDEAGERMRGLGAGLRRLTVSVCLTLVFGVLLLAGLGFLVAALYLAWLPVVGAALAALLAGLVACAVGALGLGAAAWIRR